MATSDATQQPTPLDALPLLGAVAAVTIGPWLVLVLIACGIVERIAQRLPMPRRRGPAPAVPVLAAAGFGGGYCCRSPGSPSKSAPSPTAAASSSSRSCRPTPSITTTG
ncbi:hypothetical protein NKG94_51405 [Micromonospora sp. M12]